MSRTTPWLFSVLLLLGSGALRAQIVPPLGGDLSFEPSVATAQLPFAPSVAELEVAGAPRQVLVWLERDSDLFRVYASMIDRNGTILVDRELLLQFDNAPFTVARLGRPVAAASGDGRFVVLVPRIDDPAPGERGYRRELLYRSYRPIAASGGALQPLTAAFLPLVDVESLFQPDTGTPEVAPQTADLAAATFGRFAVVFADDRNPEDTSPNAGNPPASTNDNSVHLSLFDLVDDGSLQPFGAPILVANNAEPLAEPRVALEPNSGAPSVFYRRGDGALLLSLHSPVGQSLGAPVVVQAPADTAQTGYFNPDIARDLQGNHWLAWERNHYGTTEESRPNSRIQLQQYSPNGGALGALMDASTGPADPLNLMHVRRRPVIAANDTASHVAVAWSQSEAACRGLNPAVPIFSGSCNGSSLAGGGGTCSVSLGNNPLPGSAAGCRISVRLLPAPGETTSGWYRFKRDQPREFIISGGPTFTAQFDFSRNFEPEESRCLVLEVSGHGENSLSRRVLEQPCSGSSCNSCLTEPSTAKASLVVDTAGPLSSAAEEAWHLALLPWSAGKGIPESVDQDVVMRWVHRESGRADFTFVDQFVVPANSAGVQRWPALGQLRDGEMLVAWTGEVAAAANVVSARRYTRPVEISVNDIGILEGPIEATGTFTLSASKPHPVPGIEPKVSYLTADDSASFLSDYTRTTGTAVFGGASPTNRFVAVPVIEDTIYEDNELFFLNLSNATDAVLLKRQGIGVIVDNDTPEVVEALDARICENGSPAVPGEACPSVPVPVLPNPTVTIMLSIPKAQEVAGSVQFRTLDGTFQGGNPPTSVPARAGIDYEQVTGEAQFPAGTTTAFVSVEIIDNALLEQEKNFRIELFDPDELTLGEESIATVHIVNDDSCADPATVSLPGGGSVLELPVDGGAAYACVNNPAVDTCGWSAQLEFAAGAPDDWLHLLVPAPIPPAVTPPAPPPEAGCGPDDNGYVVLTAQSNVPKTGGGAASGQQRNATLRFLAVAGTDSFLVSQVGVTCELVVSQDSFAFYPHGGEGQFQVTTQQPDGQVGECAALPWTLQNIYSWIQNVRIDGQAVSSGVGAATVSFRVTANADSAVNPCVPGPGRCGTLLVGTQAVSIQQEEPYFDHFDDAMLPAGWQASGPGNWSESGTRLQGSSLGQAGYLAQPAFPGCLVCRIETQMRIDAFGKGQALLYAWYVDDDNHVRLSMNEFTDRWQLVQRRAGQDEVLRTLDRDIFTGVSYPILLDYEPDSAGILLTISGQVVCPPSSVGQPCLATALSEGTVGFGVSEATVSFDLIRVSREDGPPYGLLPLPDPLFDDGFED